jgi:hypothetical protein
MKVVTADELVWKEHPVFKGAQTVIPVGDPTKAAASTARKRRNIWVLFGAVVVLASGLVFLFTFVIRQPNASNSTNTQQTLASGNTALPASKPSTLPNTDVKTQSATETAQTISSSNSQNGSAPTVGTSPFPAPVSIPAPPGSSGFDVTEVTAPVPSDAPQAFKEAENALNKEYEESRRNLSREDKESQRREQVQWLRERGKSRNKPGEYLRMTWERVQDLNHSHTHSGE